jgi:hypothetical protein
VWRFVFGLAVAAIGYAYGGVLSLSLYTKLLHNMRRVRLSM